METGTEGRENQSARDNGEAGATILRFPRDWFGPPEELVPFGPRAAGSAVAGDEGSDGATSEIDARAGTLRADAFWTEEAARVHDAVDAGERLDVAEVAEVARSGAGFGRRNLLIACCAVGLLLLVAAQVFPSGSAPPAREGRAAAAVHMHPWTAISHPALSRRTPRRLKPGARHAPAPSRAREPSPASPAVTQSASSEAPPQPAPAATPVEAAPAPSNTETAQSSGPGQADASAASAKSSSSQPAFGANGTLGPGSSPNS